MKSHALIRHLCAVPCALLILCLSAPAHAADGADLPAVRDLINRIDDPDVTHTLEEIFDIGRSETGACCTPDGGCQDFVSQFDCEALFGTFHLDVDCASGPCGAALPDCDFNADGVCDCADVDPLVQEIVAGTNGADFDLTGDGVVTTDDLDAWLAEAGAENLASGNPYRPGDANLDGFVDGQDFIQWNAAKFTNTTGWCSGDFNADGVVDAYDFNLWNENKFTSTRPGSIAGPGGPELRYDTGTGTLTVDTLGPNGTDDTAGALNLGGDDIGMVSVIIDGPEGTPLALTGLDLPTGTSWVHAYFNGAHQFVMTNPISGFFPPGEIDLVQYATGLGAGDFNGFAMGRDGGSGGQPTANGQVQIVESYCLPTFVDSCRNDHIDGVEFVDISNLNTGCGGPRPNNYTDYTALATTVEAGSTHPITAYSGLVFGQTHAAFIDFNQDFDFDDPGEFFLIGYTPEGTSSSIPITIPATATLGTTRLRVMCLFSSTVFTQDRVCGTSNFGEVEDYTLQIVAPPTGACCFGDGSCQELEEGDCIAATGTFLAIGVPCTDNDGDGVAAECGDCDDIDPTTFPGAPELCDGLDNDCDGVVPAAEIDNDGDGFTPCDGDCDDIDPTTFPGAPELCDGIDNDCDGVVPADEIDNDGDGLTPCGGDCDDIDPTTFPGALELCDGIDNDCDGVVPADEIDNDGDGFTPCGGDCDEFDPTTFPGAPELCDGLDNDCDGVVPAAEIDNDGDGFTPCDGDCDDFDPATFPGAAELCDGIDNDCDGVVPADEIDNDGDGFAACSGDCDDNDPNTFPGAPELCDGIDNDCDGVVPANELDDDNDGVLNCLDNCTQPNPGQEDCDGNSIGDACDIEDGTYQDCNANGIPDFCDIRDDTSDDCNGNAIPDECDTAPEFDPLAATPALTCGAAQHVTTGITYFGATSPLAPALNQSLFCGAFFGANDAFYRYRPTFSGLAYVSVQGPPIDWLVSVHDGCPATTANQVACDDFSTGVVVNVVAGQDYLIRLAGAGFSAGPFQLTLTGPPALQNPLDADGNQVPDPCECPPDVNGDGVVDTGDFLDVMANLGACPVAGACPWDVDNSGIVNEVDLQLVLANQGPCPFTPPLSPVAQHGAPATDQATHGTPVRDVTR